VDGVVAFQFFFRSAEGAEEGGAVAASEAVADSVAVEAGALEDSEAEVVSAAAALADPGDAWLE